MLEAEIAREEAASNQAAQRSTEYLEHVKEALLAAHAAAQAHREAEIQVEEAKRSVGKQTVAGEALIRQAEEAGQRAPEPSSITCNLWTMASQARAASEGVVAMRGPQGQMMLGDGRAETAEARLRARCLVGSAEMQYERAERQLLSSRMERQRLNGLAQQLAASAAQKAAIDLTGAQRRWSVAERHSGRAAMLQEEAQALGEASFLELPIFQSPPEAKRLRSEDTAAAPPTAAPEVVAVEEESLRRKAAADLYAQARLHRDLEMAVEEARKKLQRRHVANEHRAEAEVARRENEELQVSLDRLRPEGPPPGHVAFALRESLACWAKRRRLCEQVVNGVVAAGLQDAAQASGLVTDESCGQQLPKGRFDPVLGRVPVMTEDDPSDAADYGW